MQPHQKTAVITGVIDAHRQGTLLTEACKLYGVALSTVRRWVTELPELMQMLRDAEQDFNDALAEALLNIDSDRTYGSTDPKVMKVKSDNIKWILERKDRERYGQKVEVIGNATADQTIITALREAIARIPLPASYQSPMTITTGYADITERAELEACPAPPPPPPVAPVAPPPIPTRRFG